MTNVFTTVHYLHEAVRVSEKRPRSGDVARSKQEKRQKRKAASSSDQAQFQQGRVEGRRRDVTILKDKETGLREMKKIIETIEVSSTFAKMSEIGMMSMIG